MEYLKAEDCKIKAKEIAINRIINEYINPVIEKAIANGRFNAVAEYYNNY